MLTARSRRAEVEHHITITKCDYGGDFGVGYRWECSCRNGIGDGAFVTRKMCKVAAEHHVRDAGAK